MATKETKHALHRTRSDHRRRSSRRRRRSSRGIHPLVWVGGALGVVVILVIVSLLKPDVVAETTTSRSENPADLLPLAEPVRPLQGGHDVALIPQQTPAPRQAPANVSLPRLDMPSTGHGFGRIPKRLNVAHVFAVQNSGAADLEIRNLVTSCGCTTAQLSSSIIPPGRRADLTVAFDPDFHETRGDVTRLVWFATNDSTQPWIEVRITADVQP